MNRRPKVSRKRKGKYRVGEHYHGDPPLPRGKWRLERAGSRGDTDWRKIGEAK